MFRTETRTIGGLEYRISQLTVDNGIEVGVVLVKALGPALLAVIGGESLDTIDKGALADALQRLDPAQVKYLCKVFAEKSFVKLKDGKTPRLDHVWEAHFAGKYKALVQWLAVCVEMNFSDFLGSSGADTRPTADAAPSS